ncbi:MAG: GlcG/HbpS family heme-binding protein [Acidimicrobiia bacterium]
MTDVDLATAQGLVRKAVEAAHAQGLPVAAVVVDRGGHPVAMARMDGVSFVMSDAARRKATMASAMGTPTQAVAEMAQGDDLIAAAFTGSEHVIALGGGLPIMGDAGPIGGFGIAGGHYTQDQAIADAAAAT